MIAAIVAPAGVRNIARMRACLVSGRVEVFDDECADRERGLDLLVTCAADRVEAFLDLDFVMGSSEVMRRHPPHHLSPRPGRSPGRARPRSALLPPQVTHTNPPPNPKTQPILSKKVARWT